MFISQINNEDILPKNLCQQCLTGLTFVYEFINKCRKSEEVLQTSLTFNEHPRENPIESDKNEMECIENPIECNESKTEIKIEEHALTSEIDIKTETIVKEESDLGLVDTEEKEDVCPECKYYLPYWVMVF